MTDFKATRIVDDLSHPRLLRRKVRLEVLHGPDAGRMETFGAEEITVGSLAASDLPLTDTSVSRYHLRIATSVRGFVITDLDSTNGTYLGSLRLGEVTASDAVTLRLGDTELRLTPLTEEQEVPLHTSDALGPMVGRSPQMRALFAQVGPVAASDATVLLGGETGTGKELLAEQLHADSPRRDHPFIVVDCAAIPDTLIESELFGHTRGSFTGATARRTGALELAQGGTVFLDEVGELSPAAQPRLLRALESRTVKPVGSDRYIKLDVRVIAATNRDLRLAVNKGTFRADLFYRLSVVRLQLPPLRERPEDIELLASRFMTELWQRFAPGSAPPPVGKETVQRLVSHTWPGNVRELRNFMERVAVLAHGSSGVQAELDPEPEDHASVTASINRSLPYKEAKMRWIDRFEVAYITDVLRRSGGNVAAAARQAGVDRTYLFRLIRKYGIKK